MTQATLDEQLKTRTPTPGWAVTGFGPQRPRSLPECFFWRSNGELVMGFDDHFGGVDDEAPAEMRYMVSRDQGMTWVERGALLPNDGKISNLGPSLLRLRAGRVALVYMRNNDFDDLKIYFRTGDESLTNWSEPTCVTPEPGYHCSTGTRLIQLRSGRLLYPVAYIAREFHDGADRVGSYVGHVWRSDDEGKTWARNATAVTCPTPAGMQRGAMEPCVVELNDGRIMMLMRTQLGFLYQSFSADEGETWSCAEPSALESPESCPFVTRIPSTGDLLAIWNHARYDRHHPMYGIRRPLSVAISRDEGQTWSNSVPLETDGPYTYAMPVATFDDRWVIFGYYRAHGIQWAGHLQCMINRWRLEDLYQWTTSKLQDPSG